MATWKQNYVRDFYPRSPCGERPRPIPAVTRVANFYPRSPCGERRLPVSASTNYAAYFYPRSPCGERQLDINRTAKTIIFLSTLSLRRATACRDSRQQPAGISIHALLAESDHQTNTGGNESGEFLSTLSLRRATRYTIRSFGRNTLFLSTLSLRRATSVPRFTPAASRNFYPRSPCGERLVGRR